TVVCGEGLIARERGRPVRAGAEALFLASAAYGQVYDAARRLRCADAYGQVLAPESIRVQEPAQPVVHIAGLGGAHGAGGAAVQPVDGVEGRRAAQIGCDGGADR